MNYANITHHGAKMDNLININVNFLSLLTLLFITLKLTHFIDWSWWWILSPLWIPLIIILIALLIFIILYFIFAR